MTEPEVLPRTPSYKQALKEIVLIAWIYSAFCSFVFTIYLGGFSIEAFLLSFFFSFFIAGTLVLLFGSLLALPLWFIYARPVQQLNRITPILCAIIASLMGTFFILGVPMDYSGTKIGISKQGLIILMGAISIGALSGWTGFQIAQRRRNL